MGSTELGTEYLLSIASLFEGRFYIDWILQLTEIRASTVLREFNKAIERGWLEQPELGIYCFIDPDQHKKLRSMLPANLVESFEQRIIDLYLSDTPDEAEFPKRITAHLLSIENDLKGCQWLFHVGLYHKRLFERNKARGLFVKVLDDLVKMRGEEADKLYIKAAIEYSRSVDNSFQVSNAYPFLKESLKRIAKYKDPVNLATIEIRIGNVEWYRDNYQESYSHYEKACTLLKEIEDPGAQRSLTLLKIVESTVWGNYRDALIDVEKFTSEVAEYPRYWSSFRSSICLGLSLSYTGHIAQGIGLINSLRNHCRKIGDVGIACEASVQLINIFIDIRQVDKAIQEINETLKEATNLKRGLLKNYLLIQLAYCYYLNNEFDKAFDIIRDNKLLGEMEFTKQVGYPIWLELVWAIHQKNDTQFDNCDLQRLIAKNTGALNVEVRGIAFRLKALLEASSGKEVDQVIDSLLKSESCLEESGHRTELIRTRIELRRFFISVNDKEYTSRMEALITKELDGIDPNLIPGDIHAFAKINRDEKAILSEILKLSREIATIRDTKELVQQIIVAANRITGAERGAIFLLDSSSKRSSLKLRASISISKQDVRRPEFECSMALVRQTMETGEGCIKDFSIDPNRIPTDQRSIHSCICVPMIIRDKVVGVLYHDNSMLDSNFKDADLMILSHYASQAAIAIDNAETYELVKRLNRDLKEEKDYYKAKASEHLHFDEIVGNSQAIINVLSEINRVAVTDATVMILGETGVGKELVARAVHSRSLRSEGPFIRVQCSNLPENLISSELFGHEKGSFTGAILKRIGRFELADNGTLFLDEVGELPLEVQGQLLRVLQTGEFERLGSNRTIESNFRLILATNRDLVKAVQEKYFRQDLFYRIHVFPLEIPPLRMRKEDIPLLATHFMNLHRKRLNKPMVKILKKDVRQLMDYDWPGNIRELENVIERAMIISNETELSLPPLQNGHSLSIDEDGRDLPTLEENERNLIIAALRKTNGNVQGQGGAAKLLDINPHTLKSRMRKLGIVKKKLKD